MGTDTTTNSILDSFKLTGDIDITRVIITLALSFLIGIFVYLIYKRTFTGVLFVKGFGTSLIMLCMVTSTIILTITTNLMLSLGMVGALSIVRFRTAVKDPMDTIYMFWAIAAGITIGAQLYTVAILTSLGIGVLMLIVSMFKMKKTMPYLLVIRFEDYAKREVQMLLKQLPQGRLKAKTVSGDIVELTIEMNIKESEANVVDKFVGNEGVLDASLISYSGDVVS